MKTPIIAAVALATALFVSCKKEIGKSDAKPKPDTEVPMNRLLETKADYLKEIARVFMEAVEANIELKRKVYAQCGAQVGGDYYTTVNTILEINTSDSYAYFSEEVSNYLVELMASIEGIDTDAGEGYTDVTIFVPFIEDVQLDELLANLPEEMPQVVVDPEYNEEQRTCPGYNYTDGELTYSSDVAEDYAWVNQVWVFGQEEVVSAENMEAGRYIVPDEPEGRFNGQSEKGAILQVTDLGALEKWTAGKFEFRFFVFNATGTKINEMGLKKQQRKKFKNDQWVDFNKFLFNWNTAVIGAFTIEAWIEEDGGNSTSTVSQTLPPPCTGCPSTTISFTKQKHDDNMGQSIVQFTDPITTEYSLTASNFKRKN